MKSVFTYLLLQWLALATTELNATGSGSDGLEVTIIQNGTATAGETSFSLSCCVTLPQWMETFEELNIQFIALRPDTVNDSDYRVLTMKDSVTDSDCANTSVLEFTTLKTSHGGVYTCRATFNSSSFEESNITVNVQVPTPMLTITRDPDANVTLSHGDPLNLTCIIQLDKTVDSNVMVTGELSGPGGIDKNVTKISERRYQIRLMMTSLNATPSDVYTCNTTVDPGSGVVNVLNNKDGYSTLNITVELDVTTTVEYIPPPNFVSGPNEYRAASGPVTVACSVEGATGEVSYNWTSTCRSCDFKSATNESVRQPAVHIGDNGTHTCRATDENGNYGSGSIDFNIVGAGIHVFKGNPEGSLPNNGIVRFLNVSEGFRLHFFCSSFESEMNQVVNLRGLKNLAIGPSIKLFTLSNSQPGELTVISQKAIQEGQQGIYTCHITMANKTVKEINIGLYTPDFNAPPVITDLMFTPGTTSSTLTCTSTGSPATNVTWTLRNDQKITLRDEETLNFNGTDTCYEMKQSITDRYNAKYENVLTITGASESIQSIMEYKCTVNNELGSSEPKSIGLTVTISPADLTSASFGENYILTCNTSGIIDSITYQWSGPGIEGNESQLFIDSFKLSDAGKYTCTATASSNFTSEASKNVTVKVPKPTVSMDGRSDLYSGSRLMLTCRITVDMRLMTNITVTTVWNKGSAKLSSTERMPITEAKPESNFHMYTSTLMFNTLRTDDRGNYKCLAIISHPSQFTLNGTDSANKTIAVRDPPLNLFITSNTTRLPNVHPYNTFSLTCNATLPEGVVSPKTFTWKINSQSGFIEVMNDSSTLIQIYSYNLDQPASTSVLTVTETAAGEYLYQCQVELMELNINRTMDAFPIMVTTFTLTVNITTNSSLPIAGESYTLICTVTVTEGVPDTLTANWSGPGVGMDGVTAEPLSAQNTRENGSTFSFYLIFNPLRQSYDGNYTCTAELETVSLTNTSLMSAVTVAAPAITIDISSNIRGNISFIGETILLNCTVSGAGNLDGTVKIQWNTPNRVLPQSLLSKTIELTDAGQYICCATISASPYLNDNITKNMTKTLHVSIPRPMVTLSHDGRSPVYSGSVITLTCTITLDATVVQNEQILIVTNTWLGRYSEFSNKTRITETGAMNTSVPGQYTSTVTFNTLRASDAGDYTCRATVTHHATPQFFDSGVNTDVLNINIQVPNVALSLTSNTTRLPNVPPYNTFSLTCTATVPEGVVSPKTFTWWRQSDVMNSSLAQIDPNGTIQITTSSFDQPVNTSVLTVTETTAGNWSYRCNVTLKELINITNEIDSHPIHVTRPNSPELPVDLIADTIETESATISWIVPTIAFTPEIYVVHYGTSMNARDKMSDPVDSISFTAMNYKFSITLNDLTPNTMYFYHVTSANSIQSISSQVQNFTTGSEGTSPFPAAAAGGGVAAVLLIVLLCIAIAGGVWWQTKHGRNKVHLKLQKRGPSALDTMISVELITIEEAKVDNDNIIEISTFQDIVRNSIPVAEFSNHVSRMHTDENGFEFEYNSVSKEPLASYDVSQISCNKERNRFLNIYPYNFSRVKLTEIEGVEGSDYINANFLNGYVKENEYIAAQGPVPESVGDFWRMIWEYKLTTIVMLTKCEERGKHKCEQYWPDEVNQTLEPGFNLKVTLTTLLPLVEYEIRKFTVADLANPKEPAHEVTHFHYTAWPDHGVPSDATSLINFIKRVREAQPHSTEVPLLVHCSAGVGRTGTFIAIDIEMQRIEAEGVVDVYGCLKKLRTHRILMVQTLTQYVFIHEALNELILCGRTDIPAANLRITTDRMCKIERGKLITGFEKQFEILEQLCIRDNQNFYSEATDPFNLSKNRYPAVVAGNHYRVYLKYTGAPGSDYINANFIDGYRQQGAYIATQGPIASTVKDFWRMIWEHQSKCIVMLCDVEEEGEESCHPYWPDQQGSTETHGKIAVTLLSEEDFGNCIIRKLGVTENTKFAGTTGPATVTQFHFLGWPKFGEPSPPSSLLDVMENVAREQMATGNGAITVMCNDGVGRTGVFICLHAQLERLKTEGVVDCFQFIKSARLNRPGLVQNVGQYILCHEVLADFVNSFETYANFKELV